MSAATLRTGARLAGAAAVGYLAWRRFRPGESLRWRVVVITGGSRGLGLLLARQFAREGCRIAICARDPNELERARRELVALGAVVLAAPCDVSEREEVRDFVRRVNERFGAIDILVNNAGIILVGPVETMTEEDFQKAMDITFWGAYHATMEVLPQMRARRSGRIVNVTSIGGKVAVPHLLPYTAAKFALVGLSEGMRAELASDGVRVTTVVPGLMRTGSTSNAFFKGKAELEYTWFSLGGSTPLTAMAADAAARRIVQATRRGESEVTLSWQAKILRLAHGLFPGTTADLLGLVNRVLPAADGSGKEERRGMRLATALSPSPLTTLSDRAACRNNEYGGTARPSPAHAAKVGLPPDVARPAAGAQ